MMSPLADLILQRVQYRLPQHLTSYVPGVSPLSTHSSVAVTLASYLAVIFGIQAVMKNQQAKKLTTFFQIHNVALTCGSLVLLVLILEEIIPITWNRGLFNALCAEESWTSRLEFYYMINYYFKYVELLDTVFLVLKKKPLQFLHVFHHSVTALICYMQLNGRPSLSWAIIALNLTVHVIMYYYYYRTAAGARFWWKKYLTTMQIGQFVIDIGILYFGSYQRTVAAYYPKLPHFGSCATISSKNAIVFACAIFTIYLGLFIDFYLRTYKTSANSGAVHVRPIEKAKSQGNKDEDGISHKTG